VKEKENKAIIEKLSGTLNSLNNMITGYEVTTQDPNIDDNKKTEVETLYKRYVSTSAAYLEEMKDSNISGVQSLLQFNAKNIEKMKESVDKTAIAGTTQEIIVGDKEIAKNYIVANGQVVAQLRSNLLSYKSLITHHMASYATSVGEMVDKAVSLIKEDLAGIRQKYENITQGQSEEEIKNNAEAQSFKKLEEAVQQPGYA